MKKLLACVAALLVASVAALAATASTSRVNRFSDRSAVAGASSTLVRDAEGITATIITSGLEPGAAYTVWLVIFNNPENCVNATAPPRCGSADTTPAGRGATGSSVVYGTGQVIRANGIGRFAAHLATGDKSGALFGPGLLNPAGAEVHLIVRSHGQPIEGKVDAQITTDNGGCDANKCVNEQFAQHLAFTDDMSLRVADLQRVLNKVGRILGVVPPPEQ